MFHSGDIFFGIDILYFYLFGCEPEFVARLGFGGYDFSNVSYSTISPAYIIATLSQTCATTPKS